MAAGCVRVEPPFVEFTDVAAGGVYQAAVTVTNAGKTSRRITFDKPATKLFQFRALRSPVVVAPGLSVSGVLEFSPEDEVEVRDRLLIHVDDADVLEVPLRGVPRACCLLMATEVDFGCVVASSQVISKQHPITNQGSAPGVFQVQYSGDSSISLTPCSGVIAAGTTQWLKVELRTDRPRRLAEKAEVKFQNRSAVVLRITAEVVDQQLEIFDLQGSPLSCLWFGPVYFGASAVEHLVLRNASPQPCDWVCCLQAGAAGTEGGTDLQKSTDAALLERTKRCSPVTQDVSHVLLCVPKQGRLAPYDQTTVAVRFSPVSKSGAEGRKRGDASSRQDFCLFLLFECVGSRHGFTHLHGSSSSVELAVTGSGLPVSLVPSPSERFHFHTCVTGHQVDRLCVLQNLCPQLPVSFRFRKVAHFSSEPSAGTIGPGQRQDVVLSFSPRQQGSFRVQQKLDVLGYVISQEEEDGTELQLCSLTTVTLHFSAVCHSETTHPVPKVNLSSSTGPRPHVRCSELPRCRELARVAVLSADKTRLHKHGGGGRRPNKEGEEEFLAFPDDRASSIRPASPNRQYRTIFTGMPRYCYVDADYAFTQGEEEQRQRHRRVYADFIKQLRQARLQRVEEREQEKMLEDVDIGIVPGHGLVPPTLRIRDMDLSETKPNWSSAGRKRSSQPNTNSATHQAPAVINAVPSTNQEMADCNRTLTAEQLYQVVIGPLSVDFGEVCVRSVCVRKLDLVNNLSVHVWVQLEVDVAELQGSSPVSHVLPPRSHSWLPLTFQSSRLGPFYGPVSYSVNQQHPGQILVQALVVPLALELSTDLLVLHPTPGLLAAAGYRKSVTLRNQRNQAAEFTWRPVVTESGILFSVRPATGVVEPYQELDCEVVWHPSFSSPAEGDFDLCVHEGDTRRLHCSAKVGVTSVQLAERQVTFGSVPLRTPSTRTAVLHNTGQNHAYYQVLDVCPLPGMVVSPAEGTVPSRGQAVLTIQYNPDSVVKFDCRVEVALRNMKSIELRVNGAVAPPHIDISVSLFQFSGVHIGSQKVLPFALTNRSSAVARVTFDLSEYEDFSVRPSAKTAPGLSVVEVQGLQTADCALVFSPRQISSYDFDLPVTVNGATWPAAPSSPPPSATSSSSSLVKPLSTATQRSPHVQATALNAPLEVFPSSLHFSLQSDTYTEKVELKAAPDGSVCWSAVAGESVRWWCDCSATAAPTADGSQGELCAVSPSSGSLGPGRSAWLTVSIRPEAVRAAIRLSVPVYLGDRREAGTKGVEGQQPYRELSITISLQVPTINIHPPQVLLSPVPLKSHATATLTLLADGYPRGTSVSAEVEEVETGDGTKIQPVSVTFPEGNAVPAQDRNQRDAAASSLLCTVTFCSAVPLSLCTTITFSDHRRNRFKVLLCAATDNCLLTVWPYMALHHSEQQIVLKTGSTAIEAILQRFHTPSPVSAPTSSASSFDHNSSITKTSDSFPDSDSVPSRDRDESPHVAASAGLGVPQFPADDTEEGLYHQAVLLAVERWFSLFGWPGGPHPITVPHTLRRVVSKTQADPSNGRAYRVSQNKDSRSVLDMLHHLTGRQIPGVPRCQTLPRETQRRTNQLLQEHQALLEFLRAQGACLAHIRPQYLLDELEFKHWRSQQAVNYGSVDYESLSKRSWTDVLVQIYKVLVLSRVPASSENAALSLTDGASKPLASNIYSPRELQLLSWLNVHYQSMRQVVWGTGRAPSSRWIVNFDLDLTDGLVLAGLLAAYCPYLISSHFQRMYTAPTSLEQLLHNNIIVTQALTALSLNVNVQPTDLSDPNPVQMLMLCAHLYQRLPQYVPMQTIALSGGLHSTFSKQVRLRNPSAQPVRYKALILGEDAPLFSLPGGSAVVIPPESSTEVSVHFSCSFLRPMEAALVLVSSAAFGLRGAALTFTLKTCVAHIKPTKTVQCESPCYLLQEIQVPLTNTFDKEAHFKVVLVESAFNPLEPEPKTNTLLGRTSSEEKVQQISSDTPHREALEDSECSDFLSAERSVYLKSGQTASLTIHFLPFCPGTKYCSVLLVCPQVGDMVYMVKATSLLPLPSPLTARPSANITSIPVTAASAKPVCVSVLSLECEAGRLLQEALLLPRINMQWEQALATWAQRRMSAEERRRRLLTHTLHSSSVRAAAAAALVVKGAARGGQLEYTVEVSSPQYFSLPSTVTIPIKEGTSIPWDNPADCGCVEIPLRFQADSAGRFTCEVVLRSWCDTRVYQLEAVVTSQGEPSLHNDCGGTKPVFPLRGAVERPLPVDHVVLHCPLGKTTRTQLDVPNHSGNSLILTVVTDLSIVSGPPSLQVGPGHSAPYPLAVSPWKRGTQTGCVSFVEQEQVPKNHSVTRKSVCDPAVAAGNVSPYYKVCFSLEIICEPAAPVKSSAAIEIPVNNPGSELLVLDVQLEGDGLSGSGRVSVPPRRALVYRASFSPSAVGKGAGSVLFQSEVVGEFWYQLELYALPPPVMATPQARCQLGKWTRLTVPLVNPTAETLQLTVANSNPRNFTLEADSGLTVEPHSSARLGIRFHPSTVGEGNHKATIAFTCPQLQDWRVLLSGRGLQPCSEEPLSVSSAVGSVASVAVRFTNPSELPATLSVTLTDEDLSGDRNSHPLSERNVFSTPLSQNEGVRICEGASLDVPVLFAPTCARLQKAWLCITLKPDSSDLRSDPALSTICWTYPLCGIPTEGPAESGPLCELRCGAGCQLEQEVEVLLTGLAPESPDQKGQEGKRAMEEDFQCEVVSEGEEEQDGLTASVGAARRDPENGSITLSIQILYAPRRACRSWRVLAVRAASGNIWEFPIIVIATEPQEG